MNELEALSSLKVDKSLLSDEMTLFGLINTYQKFPPKLEVHYQRSLNFHFFKNNIQTIFLLVGLLCLTFLSDLWIFNVSTIPVYTKIALLSLCFISLIVTFFSRQLNFLVHLTAVLIVLTAFQIFLCVMVLPLPFSKFYSVGYFIIMLGSILVFRLSYKHLYVCTITIVLLQGVLQFFVFDLIHNFQSVLHLFNDLSIMVFLGVVAMLAFGLSSARVAERMHRNDWLNSQLLRVEKEKQNKLMKVLRKKALTDELTHTFNRRFFDTKYSEFWQKHANLNMPLSIIMIDVDCFKKYNDHYGHQKGDECLKKISACLAECVRKYNFFNNQKNSDFVSLLARYGGEEFVVLLPNSDTKAALDFAEILRASVEQKSIIHEYSGRGVCTISVGTATISGPSNQDKAIAMARIIREADDALYEAKRLGRNTVVSASSMQNITIGEMMSL